MALMAGLCLAGCASVLAVKSEPLQADVFVLDSKTGDRKSLGKTPIEMPMLTFREVAGANINSGQYFTLLVEKQGFVSERLQIPASRFGTLVTALNVKLKQGNSAKEERAAREVLDHLFLAQKFAVSRQYERAQIELDRILADFPGFPRALSMRASIYYMQKNYTESLKWYEEALKVDPQMEDAILMSAKIRGVPIDPARAPASSSNTKPPEANGKPLVAPNSAVSAPTGSKPPPGVPTQLPTAVKGGK